MNDEDYLVCQLKVNTSNILCYLNMSFENEVFGLARVYCNAKMDLLLPKHNDNS